MDNITTVTFCDKYGTFPNKENNNLNKLDIRSYNSCKYLAVICSDNTKFYITHDSKTKGTIFKYNFYIGDIHTQLLDKQTQYNIAKSATELYSRFNNGTLYRIIYEPYIESAYNGYCSCYTAATPLTEEGINSFIK